MGMTRKVRITNDRNCQKTSLDMEWKEQLRLLITIGQKVSDRNET